jgi:Xaa-Pro aminopeptidase
VRLGAGWNDPHDAAVRCLVAGMVEHRLLRGSVDGLVESGEYRRFYMHRTGHWLGLDVHDAGDYKEAGRWKTLRAGMVLTVEPGIYIRPGEGVPEEFWHIGIRIEDDALVTDSGADIITSAAPKQVADIEALVGQAAGQHAAGLD